MAKARSDVCCRGGRPEPGHTEAQLLRSVVGQFRQDLAAVSRPLGDYPHRAFGLTGGDGVHVVWEEVAGTARAKWLLWTGEYIDAETALQWGVVNEVVPRDRAVDRGIEIAKLRAAKPALFPTLQNQTLNMNLRRRIATDVPFGMAIEGLTAADQPYQG